MNTDEEDRYFYSFCYFFLGVALPACWSGLFLSYLMDSEEVVGIP